MRMIHCRSEILTSRCTPRASEDYNPPYRCRDIQELRENASPPRVHAACIQGVRREFVVWKLHDASGAGENVARRIFIFRRRRRHVSFTSRARWICKDRHTCSFCTIPTRRDSFSPPARPPLFSSVVAFHIFRTPRKYRITSARTYVCIRRKLEISRCLLSGGWCISPCTLRKQRFTDFSGENWIPLLTRDINKIR